MGISRKTKSVKDMLSVFDQSETAMSVVELVKHFDQKMNKTTVYRILDRLEESGELHSFVGKEGLKWYAKCNSCTSGHHTDLHPHFQCSSCGKSECLEVNLAIPTVPNHIVESAELLLVGRCADCI